MRRKSVTKADVHGKKVVVRVDFNVPLAEGQVADDTRLIAAMPTLEYLRDQGAKTILISHLGRPAGPDAALSLAPVAERAGAILGAPVKFCSEETVVGPKATEMASQLKNGEFLLLENLRFNPGEKANDPEFAKQLASLGDVYVNDAFGAAHRAHASTAGVTEFLPAVAGLLMETELYILGSLLDHPGHPFTVVLGGSKVSDKSDVILSLLDVCDNILIGGAMCFTFFKARGWEIGDSLLEEEHIETARKIEELAKEKGVNLYLPTDMVIAQEIAKNVDTRVVPSDRMPAGWKGLDIGPTSSSTYGEVIKGSRTVFWNGPMGVFEIEDFAQGTRDVANAVANAPDAKTVVGGGDTDAAIHKFGVQHSITHVSTGGGASMKLLEGKKLPGVEALQTA